jgi:hypothetical protein
MVPQSIHTKRGGAVSVRHVLYSRLGLNLSAEALIGGNVRNAVRERFILKKYCIWKRVFLL